MRLIRAFIALALVSGCSTQEGTTKPNGSPAPDTPTEDPDSLGNATGKPTTPPATTGDSDGDEPAADRGPGLFPVVHRVPPPSEATCLSGEGSVSNTGVYFGQTHLLDRNHAFQNISAGRPLSVAIAAVGNGPAPRIEAIGFQGDTELGSVCLQGPEALPAEASLEQSYRGTLPAAWVNPGLRIELSVGGQLEEIFPEVRPEAHITLVTMDALLFDEGEVDPSREAIMTEMAARTPTSALHVIHNPFGIWKPKQLLINSRGDGKSPTGEPIEHGPLLVDELPHCSEDDQVAATCSTHSGYGIMSAVLESLRAFASANGMESGSTWYADLGVGIGGGLGGGQVGTGDNWGLVMNHEVGHAWGFPHWAAQHADYPYVGAVRDRGGFGPNFAVDQSTDELWSPFCEGVERQSPMQRGNNCLLDGANLDPFTDYESARISRMVYGGEEESGSVDTQQGSASYTLPMSGGRELLEFSEDDMSVSRFNGESGSFEEMLSEGYRALSETMVPVSVFYGAVTQQGMGMVEGPLDYVGNVLSNVDPATAEGLNYLRENAGTFYWAHDVSVRFTLKDGTQLNHLLPGALHETDQVARFAINLPRDIATQVSQVQVLARPFGQWNPDHRLTEETTPESFYQDATLLLTHDL